VLTNACNDAAAALYESCGFIRENSDDVLYVLSLKPDGI
jgi:hypothetical protein